MKRMVLCWVVTFGALLLPSDTTALIDAEHPSDYVRVLESGDPALWGEAVRGLLEEDEELPRLSVSSVIRRISYLDSGLRLRLARALRENGWHPRTPETLLQLSWDPEEAVREAALESLFTLRAAEAMDIFRDHILQGGSSRIEALRALQKSFEHWSENVRDPHFRGVLHPNWDPSRGSPEEIFDRHYLPAVQALLRSSDVEERSEALTIVSFLFTPGVNETIARLMEDPSAEIQFKARWELAERGDPRPCSALFEEAETVARTWTDEYSRDHRIRSVGAACASAHFLDYFGWYVGTEDPIRQSMFREMIEGAADLDLLEKPEIVEGLRAFTNSPNEFVRQIASRILGWEENKLREGRADTIASGIRPVVLVLLAVMAAIVGALLFTWAWRLYALAVRVRHRPVSQVQSLAMGPVALEGEVQPLDGYLHHPVTGELCLYYAGADSDHPDVRFYLVDDTGRVLIDPRRAVLFSDDGVLVAGERVHLVGYARPERRGGQTEVVVVGKDLSSPPAYRKLLHRVIEILFGFGRQTSVTKMLFSDPARCYWIWDDLERRPMGEARDVIWLAAGVLLGGAWCFVFAVVVLGLIDQEMSATLANALEAVEREGRYLFGL